MAKLTRFEIRKMLELVRGLDIAHNPEPAAIYEALIQGFNINAIPSDHPGGDWDKAADKLIAGAFTKRCGYVATAFYNAEDGRIHLTTDAYALKDYVPGYNYKNIKNRPDDIRWSKEKIKWVFEQIDIPCPEIVVGDD